MAKFQFEIGQVIQHVTSPIPKMVIVARWHEECSGGTQIVYACRGLRLSTGFMLGNFFECELSQDNPDA